MKNVQLKGNDAFFWQHTFRSFMGRNTVHAMRPYPDELDALCGQLIGDGYDRNPCASPDMTFTVCGKCLKAAQQTTK
jgi:hypothetical protein